VTAAEWRRMALIGAAMGCSFTDLWLLLPLATAALIAAEVTR
jgi:hypothetical protein